MKNRNSYEFFFSELFSGDEPELGYIVELMRIAGHIKEFQRILSSFSTPDDLDEFEAAILETELEPLNIFIFNFAAAQLRESLKLFAKFMKLPFYIELNDDFNNEQKIMATTLENYVNEFNQKKGLLYETLIPLRNKMYHYNEKEASKWVKNVIEIEKDEKPNFQTISFERLEFGPGLRYDDDIFSKYLFWGNQGFDTLLKAQKEIWEINQHLLDFVISMSEILMKRGNIPSDRPFDWFMEYFYGYKKR